MTIIAALHERLHGASIESNPSNDYESASLGPASTKSDPSFEKENEKASLGTLAILTFEIRKRIWHYATLGFPIAIHDVGWVPEPTHDPSILERIESLAIFHRPHMGFPFLLTSRMINEEAKEELYNHNYSIAFTMNPPEGMSRTHSDLDNLVSVGDTHSTAARKFRVDHPDIEKTDFRRFERVTFIIQGPDGEKRDFPTSKMGQIDKLIGKAVIPSCIALRKQKLRELVIRFENRAGWEWRRNEDLQKLNNYFHYLTYGIDGQTAQLTEDNARGSLEQCLDIFSCLHDVEKFMVELPETIDLDDRLYRFLTKGSREHGGGHNNTIVRSANGKEHVFKYDGEGKLIPPSKAPSFLGVGRKESWKLYESQESPGNELGGG